MRPVFRFIAATRLQEIFTATALLLVIGIALAMQQVVFHLHWVRLSRSSWRITSTVTSRDRYRTLSGLLLGLFFISVGASIDFNLLLQQPFLILGLVIGLALVKFAVLFGLGRFFRLELSQSLPVPWLRGEFAFVLFSFATQNNVLTKPAGTLVAVVALSLMLTPLIMIVNDLLVQPRFVTSAPAREADAIDDNENPVIIAGFGRFGQMVGRLLIANGFKATVLDHGHIDMLRRFG